MSTPNHTGITQPLNELIAAVRALSPEKRSDAEAKITTALGDLRTSTQQEVATVSNTAVIVTRPEPLSTSEQRDLTINFLDTTSAQYDQAYQNWKATFQLPAEYLQSLATKDTVMAWVKTIPQETIQAILKYGQPRLKLLTEMPVISLLRVLDQHKTIPGQNDSVIWWNQWRTVAAKPGDFGLTPDTKDMPQENIYQDRNNSAIIAEYKRRFEQTPLSTTMPQAAYLPSAMDQMAQGKVYDRKYVTGFEQPQGADGVPDAYWRDDRVRLDRNFPGDSGDFLRGRLWVSPEKKN